MNGTYMYKVDSVSRFSTLNIVFSVMVFYVSVVTFLVTFFMNKFTKLLS